MNKKCYYFKQYGFNGANLYNVFNINTVNISAKSMSPICAAGIIIAGLVALS